MCTANQLCYEISGVSSIWECTLVSAESGYRRIVHNCPSGIGNMKGDSVYIKKIHSKQ